MLAVLGMPSTKSPQSKPTCEGPKTFQTNQSASRNTGNSEGTPIPIRHESSKLCILIRRVVSMRECGAFKTLNNGTIMKFLTIN